MFCGFTTKYKLPFAHDGDTIYYNDSTTSKIIHGRLNNIDCPELKQLYGSNSRDSVQYLLHNSNIKIITTGIDKYNRHLVNVFIDNKPLDSIIIANGWGYVYLKYCKKKSLIITESIARSQKKGVWNLQPLQRPWDYRQHNRF